MRKTMWVLLAGLLITGELLTQDVATQQQDSLLQVIAMPPNDTADFLALEALIKPLIWTDKVQAREYIDELIDRATRRNNLKFKVTGLVLLANLQMTSGRYDSALYYNSISLQELNERPDMTVMRTKIHLMRGVYYQSTNEYEDALKQYSLAYEIAETEGHDELFGKILNNMGILYRRLLRPLDAQRAYERSVDLKTQMGDKIGIANSLNNLGIVQMELGNDKKALASFQRARTLYLEMGEETEAHSVDLSLGQAYYNTERYDLARSTWENALQKPGLKAGAKEVAYTFLGLSDISWRADEYSQALEYANEGFYYGDKLGIPRLRLDMNRAKGQAFKGLGQMDSAAIYFSIHAAGIDEVLDLEREKEKQSAAEEFQAKLREAEISRQGLVIEQQKQEQWLLALGIGLLSVLALGIYLLYRSRLRYQTSEAERLAEARRNELAQLQKTSELNNLRSMIEGQEAERKRVAKDLHDGLGGLLATVKARMSSAGTDPKDAEKLIDRACTEVRRISHNMAPQTLTLSGLIGAIEDISAQMNLRGLHCEFEVSGQPELRLDEGAQVMLIRIVQELTHNIVKHADAEKVFIQLLDQPDQILLTVEDDGVGFDTEAARQSAQGLGLSSVDSRAAYLNGTLLYDSTPGHGTTINLSIPL